MGQVHGLAIHNDTPHVSCEGKCHVMLIPQLEWFQMAPLAGVGKESVSEINTFYVTSHFSGRLSLAAEHLPRV